MILLLCHLLGIPMEQLEEVSRKEYNKHQLVRLADIFILVPFLIYASTLIEKKWVKYAMISFGIMILAYNVINYSKSYNENTQ